MTPSSDPVGLSSLISRRQPQLMRRVSKVKMLVGLVVPSLRRDIRFLGVREVDFGSRLRVIAGKYIWRAASLVHVNIPDRLTFCGRPFWFGGPMDLSHLQYVILDVRDIVRRFGFRQQVAINIVDVGAHNGETAIAFDLFLPGSIVYSFEPNPTSFERARANTSGRNVKLFRLGLSDHNGAELFVMAPWDAMSTFELPGDTDKHLHGASHLTVQRGDEIIDLTTIDFLKVDVEGYEGHVMRGLEGVLDRVQFLAIEWSLVRRKDNVFGDLAEILSRHDFDLIGTSPPSYSEDGANQITVDMYFHRTASGQGVATTTPTEEVVK